MLHKALTLAVALLCGSAIAAHADPSKAIKIGVLSDMSGPYADQAGLGSVEAARMAIEDAGGSIAGQPIEILSADHQHKTDVATAIVRRWIDVDGVDVIVDMPNSAVALAVQQIVKEKNKVALFATAATTELTGKQCSPNGIQWVYDAYSNAAGLVKALVAKGEKSWYFLTVDYALGLSLQAEATKALTALGGTVVGSVRHPLNNADFGSFLLQAQASKARVIALANAGADTINSVKQAAEFGLNKDHIIVTPLVYISDIHSMGLQSTQGLTYVEGFYWDLNDDTRAWSKRFFEKRKAMPTMTHAGVYSSVAHYLKAVKAAGTSDTTAVLAKMREMPVNDFFARGGTIRADGRMVHDMLLVQVKSPSESKYPYDYYKVLATIPGDQAFRPLSESECPLVK
ncbi:ABC transporter substrate-binding protein [Bradyrhizobium sp. NP1]|uniref:ABC transporter substrate-binding protein n=1 Tax=Bradyrhizobium sp. NP1 TaxID=3049772 RepID=UPI0025A61727|nr:ABC transporter substrate-binding protein [Bradyrhizobium sp. NP1]WJR75750.1 ABC transporter substrate-binding protein [Bradyrhizobium sp. NP1]